MSPRQRGSTFGLVEPRVRRLGRARRRPARRCGRSSRPEVALSARRSSSAVDVALRALAGSTCRRSARVRAADRAEPGRCGRLELGVAAVARGRPARGRRGRGRVCRRGRPPPIRPGRARSDRPPPPRPRPPRPVVVAGAVDDRLDVTDRGGREAHPGGERRVAGLDALGLLGADRQTTSSSRRRRAAWAAAPRARPRRRRHARSRPTSRACARAERLRRGGRRLRGARLRLRLRLGLRLRRARASGPRPRARLGAPRRAGLRLGPSVRGVAARRPRPRPARPLRNSVSFAKNVRRCRSAAVEPAPAGRGPLLAPLASPRPGASQAGLLAEAGPARRRAGPAPWPSSAGGLATCASADVPGGGRGLGCGGAVGALRVASAGSARRLRRGRPRRQVLPAWPRGEAVSAAAGAAGGGRACCGGGPVPALRRLRGPAARPLRLRLARRGRGRLTRRRVGSGVRARGAPRRRARIARRRRGLGGRLRADVTPVGGARRRARRGRASRRVSASLVPAPAVCSVAGGALGLLDRPAPWPRSSGPRAWRSSVIVPAIGRAGRRTAGHAPA